MTVLDIYVLVLAAVTGVVVSSRARPQLHTPFLVATGAISAVSLVGAVLMAGAQHSRLATIVGFIAVVCATTSLVAGFLIADRTLRTIQHSTREAESGMPDAAEPGIGKGHRLPR